MKKGRKARKKKKEERKLKFILKKE